MKVKISQRNLERLIYIAIIIGLVIYGIINRDAAIALMQAVKDAFSILIN